MMMMMPFLIALVAVAAAGFLAGYLLAMQTEWQGWAILVEAAAARPVHVMVEHSGPLTPAAEPIRPTTMPLDQNDGDDTRDDELDRRRRPPSPTFYG